MEKLFTVIVADNADEKELFAAEEYAFFCGKAMGKSVAILKESEYKSGGFVSIGKTEFFKQSFDTLLLAELVGHDGYKITARKNFISVCGGAVQGTIFGVYALLNRLFGLKIFTDDIYTFTNAEAADIDGLDTMEKPDFPLRTLGIYPVHLERRHKHMLGNKRYTYRMRLRQMDEGWGLHNHCYLRVLPKDKYIARHPDWYDKTQKTLCLSNEEMIRQYVRNMKKIIESTPDEFIYMIGQEDINYQCVCDGCNVVRTKYGEYHSALMLYFTNKVVKSLNKWLKKAHPERKIEFFSFAYNDTELPPVVKDGNGNYKLISEELRPESNLGVLLAPIHAQSSCSLFDDTNDTALTTNYDSEPRMRTREIFYMWRSVVNKLAIWSYNANFYQNMAPCPMWNGLEENYRNFKYLNAFYLFTEALCYPYVPGFMEMKIYVISNLMWDTENRQNELVKEFVQAYYGEGNKDIYDYYVYLNRLAVTLDEKYNRKMIYVTFDDENNLGLLNKKYFTYEWLQGALEIFGKALSKASDKAHYLRILVETMPVKYALMYLYKDKMSKETKLKILDEMQEIYENYNICELGFEQPRDFKLYIKMWREQLEA